MGWIFGWLVAVALAGAWVLAQQRFARHWSHLAQLLSELSNGRPPESFVFRDGGRFAQLTGTLEKLASEQRLLREQISLDAFNLRTILASMEEGVMVVDAQHILRLANPSFRQLFDLKADPLGQSVLRTLRETAFEELVASALKTGEPQSREITMSVSKPPRHFAVHAVPMRDHTGGPGVVTIVRDISRLKQLEDVRREFVANVSHELRTPLSIFHGYLENLIDAPAMPRKEQAEILEILRKHSGRLNALLEDLLTIARLESRHEKIEKRNLSLCDLLQGAAVDWAGKVREKKLTLLVEATRDLPRICADPLRLEQVLNNLIENAVKYTNAGGQICLRATSLGEQVELRIEDTGSGIPPADLAHIFERFYRADKARSREQGGTGLGLSIVKHIVQLHGGTVTAESSYGKGTAIILRLPSCSEDKPPNSPA